MCRFRFNSIVSAECASAVVTDERAGAEKAQRNTKIAVLSTLKSVPRVGSVLWVDSADLR